MIDFTHTRTHNSSKSMPLLHFCAVGPSDLFKLFECMGLVFATGVSDRLSKTCCSDLNPLKQKTSKMLTMQDIKNADNARHQKCWQCNSRSWKSCHPCNRVAFTYQEAAQLIPGLCAWQTHSFLHIHSYNTPLGKYLYRQLPYIKYQCMQFQSMHMQKNDVYCLWYKPAVRHLLHMCVDRSHGCYRGFNFRAGVHFLFDVC